MSKALKSGKSRPASCMCWFPTGASAEHGHRQTIQRGAMQERVVATLGYQPVLLPGAKRQAFLHAAHLSSSHSLVDSPAPTAQDQAFKYQAASLQAAAYRGPAQQVDTWGAVHASLSQFSVDGTPRAHGSIEKYEELPIHDEDMMDIPIEIPQPPTTMTCTRVLEQSTLILLPTLKSTAQMVDDNSQSAEALRRGRLAASKTEESGIWQPAAPSPPHSSNFRALPRLPVRPHINASLASRNAAAGSEQTSTLSFKLIPTLSWLSVDDSGDEADWVTPVFDDPTVVIAACSRSKTDQWLEPSALRIANQDLKDAASRRELEESHGFFTSLSHPFSGSPVPQERPSAKTSGTIMSAASTNKYTSGHSTQSTQHPQAWRESPEPSVLEHWGPDGRLIRKGDAARMKKNLAEDTGQPNGRSQSLSGCPPSINDRPPSPCLRPGTLKNLTSAFENHIRRFQGGPQGDGTSRPIMSPRRVGIPTNESLRRRIETDLKMLSLSGDDSSGGSSPREHGRRSRFTNNGLLC